MATPVKWGSEFLVNTTTVGTQSEPAITALADGRFLVTWTDGSQSGGDTSFSAVRAQTFNADGSKAGGELLINNTTDDSQFAPTIAALSDGRFVVAWTDESQSDGDTSLQAVRAQIFDAAGAKSGEFLVNTATTNAQTAPTIAPLADGRFVVAWTDDSNTGGDTSIAAVRAQIFNPNSSKSGGELLVNTTTGGVQQAPTITTLADGRFAVAWTDFSQTGGDTSGTAIRAQVFNAEGGKSGDELLVNTTSAGGQLDPAIAVLPDGRFVITWTDNSQTGGDTSGSALRAQLFNGDGSKAGSEFLVNTTIPDDQEKATIAGLVDGRFVIVWTDSSQSGDDTSGEAVRGQVFNPDGSKSGEEFLINTITADFQEQPAVTALADGRFVVSWRDDSNSPDDPSNAAVRAQIFDPREGPVKLAGTALADDFVGTAFGDTLGGVAGNDHLVGAAGDDTLDGGMGADLMQGGAGNDTYLVDDAGDLVDETSGDGIDSVFASASFVLGAGVENLTLTGDNNGAGNDLANILIGSAGGNLLEGTAGNDTIAGALGHDTLTGGLDQDSFVFDTAIKPKGSNVDTITGFSVADDAILLDNAIFTKLKEDGALKKKFFEVGKKADDGNDYLVYNKKTGELFYDKNGDGKGGAIKFAVLEGSPNDLSKADFLVI